jgi:hypothetical protein
VPTGKVSDKLVLECHVHPGITANVWLWRDYRFLEASQDFVQSADEKDKPLWRVAAMNRN